MGAIEGGSEGLSALCDTLLRAGKRDTKPHTLSTLPYRAFPLRCAISKLCGHLDILDVIDILLFCITGTKQA